MEEKIVHCPNCSTLTTIYLVSVNEKSLSELHLKIRNTLVCSYCEEVLDIRDFKIVWSDYLKLWIYEIKTQKITPSIQKLCWICDEFKSKDNFKNPEETDCSLIICNDCLERK